MKKTVIVIRAFETILLVGIAYLVIVTPEGITKQWSVGGFRMNVSVGDSNQISYSTEIAGFALSIVATLLSWRHSGGYSKLRWNLALAVLGLLSLGYEFARELGDMRIMVNLGIVLLVIDWLALRHWSNTTEERESSPTSRGR